MEPMNNLEIMEEVLTLGPCSMVTDLNTRLFESIPGCDTTLMSSVLLHPSFVPLLVNSAVYSAFLLLTQHPLIPLSSTLQYVSPVIAVLVSTHSLSDKNTLSTIMADGANPNATCRPDRVSACHMAAMYENDVLHLLLTKGADSSRSDRLGRTPLHLAAWTGNVKHIAVLLNLPEAETVEEVTKHSLRVNKLTNVACRSNVESTLPDEWSVGVDHNCKSHRLILPEFQEGSTPLHAASARAHHHCVQLLLAAGADVSAVDHVNRTPMDVAGCAYYSGHKIDVNNFMETVGLLLKAGGKFLKCSDLSPNNLIDTPLHIAVELGSEAAVKQLLQGGASATEGLLNRWGLTAMHVCVEKRNKELLQLLANHKCSNENPSLVPVDVKDLKGSNVLCAALRAEWIQGICIALDAGASIATKGNGESPIQIAAYLGNIVILQKILNVAQDRNINYCSEERASALSKAIAQNHQDALELLLKNGFSIEAVSSDKVNVFHVATYYGRNEILEYLLEYDSNITKKLINIRDRVGSTIPPLYFAIENNHPDCAALLISKGAEVNVDFNSMTLLHIAARKNRCEIAEMIIENDSKTVHVTRYGWRTPLHEACREGNREMILLLLRKGADLSGIGDTQLESPIQLLMKYVPKPTELIQEAFDSCISSQDDENCSITNRRIKVDYTVLNPPCENVDRSQMRVIQALLDTGNTYDHQRLLLHPLVESFLFLKWKSSLPFFYIILGLHVCFVLCLNVFVLSLFWCKDRKVEPKSYIIFIVILLMYFSISIITMQDIIYNKQKGIRNLWCLKTWLRFLSTPLAIILPLIVSWDSESQAEWVRLFSAATLFFSWVKIMLLLSRFPNFGYYVLMYENVARRVIIILVPLGCIIVGFSVSFMIQFHAQPPFEDFWSSLLMTMVMMSEPGYKDTFNKDHESASLIIFSLTFAAFFFLCSIVLMNMLVSVAVNDVKDLELLGHKKRLEKQVEFITAFEGTARRNFVKKIFPVCIDIDEKWFEDMQWQNIIENHSRSHIIDSNWDHLPARLREAFLEKAQSKLGEIHKVIVKNDNSEPTTTLRLVSLVKECNNIKKFVNRVEKKMQTH